MPIGPPLYRPEPKSAWTGRSAPIAAMIRPELAATGRRSTRSFQALSRGESGQRGAPPTGRPAAVAGTAGRTTWAVRGGAWRTATTLTLYPRRRLGAPRGTG